jgi:hypothetical protein
MVDDIFEQVSNSDINNLHYACDNGDYLSQQLISYLGNKRGLLDLIRRGLHSVQKKLSKKNYLY